MDNLLEWRKHQRRQLIAVRETLSEVTHQQWSQTISDLLKQGFPKLQKMNIAIYCNLFHFI